MTPEMILSHRFTSATNQINVYFFDDRYRYTVETDRGIEYREVVMYTPMTAISLLETVIELDIINHPYQAAQYTGKCIRCSSHSMAAPRKEFNLAVLCKRCFKATSNPSKSPSATWYTINEDGSKGSVIKDDT